MATATTKVLELVASVEALAALGAWLRAEEEGLLLPPEVASRVAAIVEALDVEPGTADERRAAIGAARAFSRMAMDLLEDPAREPGWTSTDPLILEATGRASSTIADAVIEALPHVPGLPAATSSPGATFLDLGTGVGHLAITMCRRFPTLRTVGVDVFAPSLTLAKENVARSGVGDRITLREQDARDVPEREAFSLAWVPVPFLPDAILDDVLGAVFAALRPGGLVVAGVFRPPPSPLGARLAELRMVRSGGALVSPDALRERITRAGFADPVEPPLAASTARLFFARRP